MEIVISSTAIKWFKDEVGLQNGDKVKFHTQIYGSSSIQENFAIGFSIDNDPIDIAVKSEIDGLMFFIEGTDLWFFNGHDLHVDYNEKNDELEFSYPKS
ncbi:MAG TPA: HesB/YadR/YfhF family protein [Neobacillus sp.]|jgi:uncharacterized protein YneR